MAETLIKPGDLEYESWLAHHHRPLAGAQYQAGLVQPGAADAGINVYDIYAQGALTDIVRREVETAWESVPDMGAEIAPLYPVYDRTIRRDVAEIAAFGIGQFRAPDATPKIFNPRMTFTEELTELLLLDEMTEIKEDLWLRMTSQVPAVRARAGVDLATLGRMMQIRNERLTEVMRWQVFKGNPLVVNYDNGQQLQITYSYTSGHKPAVAVPWTDRLNSTPIDDMRAWQEIISGDVGAWGTRFHMNSRTFSYLQRSNQVRGYLTPTDRNSLLPTVEDITNLLWGGAGDAVRGNNAGARGALETPRIIVSDAGYRDESALYNRGSGAITMYLQDGEVLLTTPYVFEGEPIADVADGVVALSESFNSLQWKQGMQSEIIVNHNSKTTFVRQASARIVRLRRPSCFLLGTAY